MNEGFQRWGSGRRGVRERDFGQKMLRLTPAHSACVKGVFLGSVGMLSKIIVLSRCMSLSADWTCSDCIFSLSGWVTGLGLGGLAPVGCLLYPPTPAPTP